MPNEHDRIIERVHTGEFDESRDRSGDRMLAEAMDGALKAGVLTREDCVDIWDKYLERVDERIARLRL